MNHFHRLSGFDKDWTNLGATEQDYEGLLEEIIRVGKHAKKISKYVRVVRYGTGTRGKRGGSRVFFFCDIQSHVFLLAAYDRQKVTGLTKGHLRELDIICAEIIRDRSQRRI